MAKKKIKRRNKSSKRIFLVIIAIIVIIFIAKNNKKEEVSDKTRIIIQNQEYTSQLQNDLIKNEDVIYMSLEDIKNLIDNTIYQEKNLIITSSDKKIATLEINKDNVKINGSKITIKGKPYKNEQEKIYLPISEMKNIYDMDFLYIDKSNTVTIDYYSKELKKAYTKKKVAIKSETKNSSRTIQKVKKGDWLVYISDENGWAKVRTQEGNIGYVKMKKLTNFTTERENMNTNENSKVIDKYLKKDISKKDISTYSKRQKIIESILNEAINKEYFGVKIIFKDNQEGKERFEIESEPMLKECGIKIIFE